jgi:hypothetical protein
VRRRVLLVTDATFARIREALAYIVEDAGQADYDGDFDEDAARGFERALRAIRRAALAAKPIDIAKISSAIQEVTNAAVLSACSCNRHPPHAVDCWVSTHRRELDRVFAFALDLRKAG